MKTKLLMLMLAIVADIAPAFSQWTLISPRETLVDVNIVGQDKGGTIWFLKTVIYDTIFKSGTEKDSTFSSSMPINYCETFKMLGGNTQALAFSLTKADWNELYYKETLEKFTKDLGFDIDRPTKPNTSTGLLWGYVNKNKAIVCLDKDKLEVLGTIIPVSTPYPNPLLLGLIFWFITIMLHLSDFRRQQINTERNGKFTKDMKWAIIFNALAVICFIASLALNKEFNFANIAVLSMSCLSVSSVLFLRIFAFINFWENRSGFIVEFIILSIYMFTTMVPAKPGFGGIAGLVIGYLAIFIICFILMNFRFAKSRLKTSALGL